MPFIAITARASPSLAYGCFDVHERVPAGMRRMTVKGAALIQLAQNGL